MTIFIIILSIIGAVVGLIAYLGNRGRRKETPESTPYGGYIGSVAGKKSAGFSHSSISNRSSVGNYYPSRSTSESRRDDSTDMLLTGMMIGSMNNDNSCDHERHNHHSSHSHDSGSWSGGSSDGGGSSSSWDLGSSDSGSSYDSGSSDSSSYSSGD